MLQELDLGNQLLGGQLFVTRQKIAAGGQVFLPEGNFFFDLLEFLIFNASLGGEILLEFRNALLQRPRVPPRVLELRLPGADFI